MKEMGSEPELRPIESLMRSIREVSEKPAKTLRIREVLTIDNSIIS